MRILAEQFENVDKNEKVRYRNAAIRFRLPFWDPFMPRNTPQPGDKTTIWGLPKILSQAEVWVRRPGSPSSPSELETIANPLAYFTFPSDDDYDASRRKKIEWETAGVSPQPQPDVSDLIQFAIFSLPRTP